MSDFDTLVVNFDAMASDFHPVREISLTSNDDSTELYLKLTDGEIKVAMNGKDDPMTFLKVKFSELGYMLSVAYSNRRYVFRENSANRKNLQVDNLSSDQFKTHLVKFLKEWGADYGYILDDREVLTVGADARSSTTSVSKLMIS